MLRNASTSYGWVAIGLHWLMALFGMFALGFSWLLGSFRSFNGHFSYDERKPEKNSVSVSIDTASLDAERNKHLRSEDFFDVSHYPKATFVSTSYANKMKNAGMLGAVAENV
ncbi:MAG: YceI family protein [Mariprofundus sp.]|nr:YceI family protein [Mariprofundus sp.]